MRIWILVQEKYDYENTHITDVQAFSSFEGMKLYLYNKLMQIKDLKWWTKKELERIRALETPIKDGIISEELEYEYFIREI